MAMMTPRAEGDAAKPAFRNRPKDLRGARAALAAAAAANQGFFQAMAAALGQAVARMGRVRKRTPSASTYAPNGQRECERRRLQIFEGRLGPSNGWVRE